MVGGDFYDFWEIGKGSFGIAIGDVCGKGAAAAALTALARHTVRTASIALPDHRPADVMRALNDAVMKRAGSGQFCTVAHAYASPVATGSTSRSRPAGTRCRSSCARTERSTSPVGRGRCSGSSRTSPHEHRTVLRRGDQIVMWTDGVSDRRGDGRALRRGAAARAARRRGRPNAERDRRRDRAAVVGFSHTDPQDDIAIIVARIRPADGQRADPSRRPRGRLRGSGTPGSDPRSRRARTGA